MMPSVGSNYQKWTFHPLKDTAKGKIFMIENVATGMNLTDTHEGTTASFQIIHMPKDGVWEYLKRLIKQKVM